MHDRVEPANVRARRDDCGVEPAGQAEDVEQRQHRHAFPQGEQKRAFAEGQQFAVARKRHGVHPLVVLLQGRRLLAGREVPEFDRLVLATCCHDFAVG